MSPAPEHRYELFGGLQDAVLAFTRGSIHATLLKRFIQICHSIALSQLNSRRNAALLSRVHGLNASDLAFDCIGDLFQRNTGGHYVQLETYFAAFPLEETSDAELLIHLRRLVSSRVNQGIFRLLNEADPSLGKILRNIKLAISALSQFEEVEKFGEPFIRPCLCDPLDHLPEPSQEDLERMLLERHGGSDFVPELMSSLSISLRSQDQFRRTVSLKTVALAFRSVCSARAQIPQETSETEEEFLACDAEAIIRLTMQEVRHRGSRLVAKAKITPELLETYCAVVEEGLTRRLVHGNGQEFTLFGALRRIDPTITKIVYRLHHRSRLEYLARLANEIAAGWMKRG